MPTRIGPKHPRRTYMREWRKHKHLSQQQVADRLGENVTKATVSRWENGRRRVPLEAYAEAIGEPVEKLYELPPPLSASAKLTDGLVDEVQAAVTAAVAKVLKRYR